LYQNLSTVLQSNIDAAAQAQLEVSALKLQHKAELDAKDVAHKSAVRALTKKHSYELQAKNQHIRELERMLVDVESAAGDVGEEFCSLEKSMKRSQTELEKTATAAKESATDRLNRYKDLQQQMYSLKSTLENKRVLSQHHILTMTTEIETLKEEYQTANDDLDDACAEIHVSSTLCLIIIEQFY
jgi:predicted  nucleic acid-binding Zn-ribbon protein